MLKKIVAKLMKKDALTEEEMDNILLKNIEKKGLEEFKNASPRIKSDAKFVVKLVKTYPECLEECSDIIFDRYKDGEEIIEHPVDEMLFAIKCCNNNVNCFKYLNSKIAKRYIEAIENSETIKGTFQGEDCEINLTADKDYIELLKYVRFGYIKSKSLYVGCMVK